MDTHSDFFTKNLNVDSSPESKDEEIVENYSVFRKISYTYNINHIVVH